MQKKPKLKFRPTNRGFMQGKFIDLYGAKCSLQESSLATQACIWLGVDEPEVKVLVPNVGWQDVPIPHGALRSGRMHLTQKMVKKLLPALQYFAKTGYLPRAK